MRRTFGLAIVLLLTTSGCSVFGGGAVERMVHVDYRNDEFPSHYWRFFPRSIDAHPGDTVVFRQQWTGEPHTVTFGTLVDGALPKIAAVERTYAKYGDSPPADVQAQAEEDFAAASRGLPLLDPYRNAAAQGAGQACYLRRGAPPADPDKPCRRATQPAFDGRFAFYSSGFIPPSGASGNSYKVKLSSTAKPGTYRFYCVIHFPFMQGELVVKPKTTPLESNLEVNKRALKEIRALASPLERAYDALQGGRVRYDGKVVTAPAGGYHSSDEYTVAIDSFAPKTTTVKVGAPLTWTIIGAHTVSFGVPRYLPIYVVGKDGTVRRNPTVDRPAGGSPKIPPVDFTASTYRIDGGSYDGSGFYSSGLLGSEPFSTYTLRFSKPGRYRYACLVHPPMVGTVVVTP